MTADEIKKEGDASSGGDKEETVKELPKELPKGIDAEPAKDGGSMVAFVGGPALKEAGADSGRRIRMTPGFEDGYCDVCREKKAVRLILEFVNGKIMRKAGVCEKCGDSNQNLSGEELIKEYGQEFHEDAEAERMKKKEEKDADARKDPSI